MKIIFYKGFRGTIIDKIISLWTFGKYSHVELVDTNNICYTSSSRNKGVRKKEINYNNGNWDIFEIECNEEKLHTFYELTKKCKYDWLGIFFYHVLPFKIHSSKKWYCSEWVARVLLNSKVHLTSENITPNELFNELNDLGYLKKKL